MSKEEEERAHALVSKNAKNEKVACESRHALDLEAKARGIFTEQINNDKSVKSSCVANFIELNMCKFDKMSTADKLKIISFYQDNPLRDTGSTSLSMQCASGDSFCQGKISGTVNQEGDAVNVLMFKSPSECKPLFEKLVAQKCI